MSQPSFLQQYHLADAFQFPHLVDEGFHDDDGDNREQYLVVLDVVQLEDNESFIQQVKLFVRVEKEVIFPTTVIRFKHIQETPHVKILLTGTLLPQNILVLVTDELVEGVEGGPDAVVPADIL